ncbi:sensor domain-containing diguanylate cyclase [Fibrobacter sp. UWB12]|uniref:GGDEF domain-containing protein n=1 Tax=Fibrobacter sp. UWB12 TaxID=1896203 RepID=UPI00091E4260|nr:sensor domain-containing diguanylate cyclase [Fibrobacter sp. UWB12]SHK37566.1 diguanylate cyclase (GGDEF) domain-containing protein [Fibrobacter sp. UWB12]
MDLQKFVDSFNTMTCVVSVEKREDGRLGRILYEVANKPFIEATEQAVRDGYAITNEPFKPGSSYERYMKKELNFEHFCYQCAIKKEPIHAYIRPEHFDFCINLVMLPLNIDDPKKAYCSYSQCISPEVDYDAMSKLSAETSSAVLKTCIKLRGAQNLQKTMDEVINDIREICNASYCCILLTDFSEHTCSVFSDSLKENSDQRSVREFLTNDFVDYAKTWLDVLAGSNCLMLETDDDFEAVQKRDPHWSTSLKNANVKSLVLLPLEFNHTIAGFIWVTNFDTSRTLQIKEILETSTFFIASEIANYQLLNKLEILSNMDLLTNVQNRNSMNNRISQFVNGEITYKSLAVIFADLNGLKPVNDIQGHDAGDQLLKKASCILTETFTEGEVYRAGGDEFLVIITDQPKDIIEAKVKKIHEKSMDLNNVSFSLGFYYNEEGGSIRKAMQEADVQMYEDKKQFYAMHPELKKR